MMLVYFIYGIAFFSMGLAVLVYPKKGSEFAIAQTIIYIAFFGIIHGISEWVQMFHIIIDPSGSIEAYFVYAELLFLMISYILLFFFGLKNILGAKNTHWRAVPVILGIALILMVPAVGWDHVTINILTRYILGVPGIFLTSYALFFQSRSLMTRSHSAAVNVRIAAGSFFFYGIFAGIVVPEAAFFPASVINSTVLMETTGVPVQVFRSVCAVLISYGLVAALNLFQIETREKLRDLSHKDELTGLLNRRGFITLAEHQLKIARRQNNTILLHSIDMDYLKWINDTLGHREGDLALIEVANLLRNNFRQSDIIARIGGDEFLALQLEKIDADLSVTAERIKERLRELNSKSRLRYKLSISIGTVRCEPECSLSLDELITQADKIMYEDKKSKINN